MSSAAAATHSLLSLPLPSIRSKRKRKTKKQQQQQHATTIPRRAGKEEADIKGILGAATSTIAPPHPQAALTHSLCGPAAAAATRQRQKTTFETPS